MSTNFSPGIKWSEVNPLPQTLPAAEYTFRLLGGKTEENGRLTVSTSIADGEFAGKRFMFSYPSFATAEWAIPEFKRLIIALGEDILEGELEAEYLNRVAGQTFAGKVFHNTYTDTTTGEERTSAKLRLSSVKAG